jgi:hypothetical protein
MFFRVMRELYNADRATQEMWQVDKDAHPLKKPTARGREVWSQWYDVFKTLPTICSESTVVSSYPPVVLLTKPDVEGVLLLRKTLNATKPYVVGFALWSPFNPVVRGYAPPLDQVPRTVTQNFTITFDDVQLQEYVNNKKCANIHLICTRQTTTSQTQETLAKLSRVLRKKRIRLREKYNNIWKVFAAGEDESPIRGAGTLVMLYTMFHILYQQSRGTYRYNAILLDVAGEGVGETREHHRELVKQLKSTRVYEKVGFKIVKEKPAYIDRDWGVVQEDYDFDLIRMAYLVTNPDGGRVPEIMKTETWKLESILKHCKQRPVCI